MVDYLPNFPPIHFGRGAVEQVANELQSREIKRPLLITDKGIVKNGVSVACADPLFVFFGMVLPVADAVRAREPQPRAAVEPLHSIYIRRHSETPNVYPIADRGRA